MDERYKEDITMNDKTEDRTNLIGVDPLAWLSEEEKDSVLKENIEAAATGNTPCLIKLQSAITIRNIAELMEKLNNISPDETELVFETGQVEKVDAAALQLLLGFYLFAIEAGKKVIWDKPSVAFCHGVELLGMKEFINLPSIAA